MMRVLLAGGGTGGHIYPAIAIARALQADRPEIEILFVGTPDRLEAELIPKEGFAFKSIAVKGFQRKLSLETLRTFWKLGVSTGQAAKIIKDFKPDVVVGTGGYVCGPVLFVAAMLRIPTLIHEQNVFPGITNRILSIFVDTVATSYTESIKYFSAKKKVIVTGNPVRPEILRAERETGCRSLGLNPQKKIILVFGGSLGAKSINNAMIDAYPRLVQEPGLQILHMTGRDDFARICGKLDQLGIEHGKEGNIIVKPYIYNMADALAAADIVVCRAGATGLAEITAKGIPAILIPLPSAAENHQEYNARLLEQKGAAVVILDRDLSGNKLAQTILALVQSPDHLKEMSKRSRALGRSDAVQQICAQIYRLTK